MNMIQEKSKSKSRRERKREARTAEILDAAMLIVVDEGVDVLTMPRLARDLDAAVGSLYRYFPGKGALVVGLQVQAIEAFATFLDQTLSAMIHATDPELAAVQRLRGGFGAYLDFGDEAPARFGLIDAMLSDPRALLDDTDAAAVQVALDPILSRFAGLLEEAVVVGALQPGDAALRTHVMWAALHGASHFRKRDSRQRAALAADLIATEAVDTLLRGWGARPQVLRESG